MSADSRGTSQLVASVNSSMVQRKPLSSQTFDNEGKNHPRLNLRQYAIAYRGKEF